LDVICKTPTECFKFSTVGDTELIILYINDSDETLLYKSDKYFRASNWLNKFLNLVQVRIDFINDYQNKQQEELKLKKDKEFIEKYKPFDIN
jgi:predicted patatin/cPLA2 family phospholipase